MKDVLGLFTRYHPRFIRSLIYMLQASEYRARDYLVWYHRTTDFLRVEKRKTLVWTTKAKVLFVLAWAFVVLWATGLMAYAHHTGSDVPLAVLGVIVLLMPFYVPYVLLFFNMLVGIMQRPLEMRRIRAAQAKLRAHKGLRIAIAGSYGKTTMREILKTVLAAEKKVAAPPGSYNTPLGLAMFIETLTGDEDVILFELGEYYPGDIKKLCAFVRPHTGIVTGINEAHLEKFGSLERTTDTIFELVDYLDDRVAYVNGENARATRRARDGDVLFTRESVGSPTAPWHISGVNADLRGLSFRMVRGAEIIRAQSKLIGAHLVGPVACAAAIARELGLSVERIEAGIRETKAFDHRMQPRVDNAGVITIDDSYNGNPDGAAAVIDFLGSLRGHKRFYVTPGLVEMGERAGTVHREIGERLADAHIECIVLIKNSVTEYIEDGLRGKKYKGAIHWFDDMPSALVGVAHLTVSGDVVLIQNDWPDQYA